MNNILKKNYINYIKTGKNLIFRVDIHLIGGCNFKCVMCDNWKNEIVLNFNYIQLQKMLLVFKNIYNCNYVRFHGQEPTMYNKLEDLILFSKKIGLKVAIKTNAWLLSNIRLIKILKYGLDELYLSIDGPNEKIHDEIRGIKGSFKKNIDVIAKSRTINPDLKIYINSVVMKRNFSELSKMLDIGLKYKLNRVSFVFLNDKNSKNINKINLNKKEFFNFFKKDILEIYKRSNLYGVLVDFSPFISRFSGESNDFIISELENNILEYKDEIYSFYEGIYGKYFYDKYGCFGPIDHSSINYNGDMFGCCVVERDRKNAVGNIIKNDLSTLWNNSKYIKYREQSDSLCGYSKKCASNFYNRKSLFKSIYLNNNLYSKNNPINYYRYLKEIQYEEIKLINNIKVNKLRQLLLSFYSKLNFYKKLLNKNNITKSDIESFDNIEFIKKLPILTKKILKENYQEIELISKGKKILKGQTSGNSGNRLDFLYNLDFKRYIKQIAIFSNEFGFTYNDSYFSLTPINCNQIIINNIKEPDYVKKVYITVSKFNYEKEIFIKIQKIFNINKKITFLHGDSKYLLFIILGFKKFNLNLPKINGISITYSYTNKSLKEFIEKELNCKVYDNYGCSEVGPINIDIKGKKEIFGDNILLEEKNGEIIVSDLDNIFFPFIRYKNGDLGKIKGNNIELYGKKNQMLNGKMLKDLDDFFYKNYSEIIAYQFDLENLYYISFKKIDEEEIKKYLLDYLGEELNIVNLKNDTFFKLGECSKFKTII